METHNNTDEIYIMSRATAWGHAEEAQNDAEVIVAAEAYARAHAAAIRNFERAMGAGRGADASAPAQALPTFNDASSEALEAFARALPQHVRHVIGSTKEAIKQRVGHRLLY